MPVGEIDVLFNGGFVTRMLSALTTENVKMQFNKSKSNKLPILIMADELTANNIYKDVFILSPLQW